MMKRTIHQAQGFDESQTQGFFMISRASAETAIINRLTGSQYRLWHYLMSIQPFADQTSSGERIYRDIPSPAEIGIAIGANRKTVEKDMRRLEELGLYAKRITGWQGYNLTAEDAHNVSAALKQAKAERATDFGAKQRQKSERNYKNDSKPLQDKGCYLAPDNRYLAPDGSYLAPGGSYLAPLAPSEIAETKAEQGGPAPAILPQTIQTSLDQQSDSCVVVGEKGLEEKEVGQSLPEVTQLREEVDQVMAEVTQPPQPTSPLASLPNKIKLRKRVSPPADGDQGNLAKLVDGDEVVGQAKPTTEEIRGVLEKLRSIGVIPNETIRRYVSECEGQVVEDAIAYIKERIAAGEKLVNPGGAFVKACKDKAKPEKVIARGGIPEEVNPISPEQLRLLDVAKAEGKIQDHFLSSDGIYKVGHWSANPWWV